MRKNWKNDIVESESEKIVRVEKAEISNFSTVSKKPGWNRKPAPMQEVEPVEAEEPEEPKTKGRKKSSAINGKKLGIIISVVAAIVVIVVAALFAFGKSKDEKLAATLEEMGRDWYENFYYDGFEEEKSSFHCHACWKDVQDHRACRLGVDFLLRLGNVCFRSRYLCGNR